MHADGARLVQVFRHRNTGTRLGRRSQLLVHQTTERNWYGVLAVCFAVAEARQGVCIADKAAEEKSVVVHHCLKYGGPMLATTRIAHTKDNRHMAYLQVYQAQNTCASIRILCYHLTVPREMQSGYWSISQKNHHLVRAAEQMSNFLRMLAWSHDSAAGWRITETQAMIAVIWSEPLPAGSC